MNDVREAKNELKTVIQILGNKIASILPENWEYAVIGFFIVGENNVSHLQFHTFTTASNEYVDIMEEAWNTNDYDDAIIEVQQLCKKLRGICSLVNDSWTAMTFSLTADGSFNIDYAYDTIKNYDSKFIFNWQSQYLI